MCVQNCFLGSKTSFAFDLRGACRFSQFLLQPLENFWLEMLKPSCIAMHWYDRSVSVTNLKQIVEVPETSLISLISVNRNVLSFQSDHHLIQWSTIYNISRPQSSTNVFFIAFCSTTDRVVCQRIRSVFPRKVHFSYTSQLNPIPCGSKINHTNPINSNFYWTTLF